MLFSVITVCLNAGEKLKESVESLLCQTMTDYELIVKDGGSTDGSVELLEEDLGESALPDGVSVRVIHKTDSGIYDGMNQALEEARGDYIYFLNCGDLLHDSRVFACVRERILSEDKKDRKARIFYGHVREAGSGQIVCANPELDDFALFRNIPCHQACFYDRRLFEERQFDLSLKVRADYEHFLWCHYAAGAETVPMDLVIADYEGGGYSESPEGRRISASEHRAVTEKYMPAGKPALYRLIMILTLQPLRERLSKNPATARAYQSLKRLVYGQGKNTTGETRPK